MRIRGKEDLRDAYSIVMFIEKNGEGPKMLEWVKEKKREIRAHVHKTSDRRMVCQDDYGYTVLINVPAECESTDEAEEWFDAEERIEFTPSPYDCSGQAFTGWHHIGVLGGKLVCWHRVDFDV